jgi:2-polyprenyl-3-methyl-5-hydroxy-6-metoxy-1,4-benzoquinol methylase
MIYQQLNRSSYGFYFLKKKPKASILTKYYKNDYFQEGKGQYKKRYSKIERRYIQNKIDEKYHVVTRLISTVGRLLDIGCGEGWILDYFSKKRWHVEGIDVSIYGCQKHNPSMSKYVRLADINVLTDLYQNAKTKYDVIWLDKILEHVLRPVHLLNNCKSHLREGGLIVVSVPNDLSKFHQYLAKIQAASMMSWLRYPDHINYFNKESLIVLGDKIGLRAVTTLGDYPIELHLINQTTNYYLHKAQGRAAHKTRLAFEDYLGEFPVEKRIDLFESFAALGLGREITVFLVCK